MSARRLLKASPSAINFPMGNLHPDRATGDQVVTAIRIGLARRNTTQGALAEHLKLSPPAVHRRMVGQVAWRIGELRDAAEFLGMSVSELIASDTKASA